jgi:hypothetical protein
MYALLFILNVSSDFRSSSCRLLLYSEWREKKFLLNKESSPLPLPLLLLLLFDAYCKKRGEKKTISLENPLDFIAASSSSYGKFFPPLCFLSKSGRASKQAGERKNKTEMKFNKTYFHCLCCCCHATFFVPAMPFLAGISLSLSLPLPPLFSLHFFALLCATSHAYIGFGIGMKNNFIFGFKSHLKQKE